MSFAVWDPLCTNVIDHEGAAGPWAGADSCLESTIASGHAEQVKPWVQANLPFLWPEREGEITVTSIVNDLYRLERIENNASGCPWLCSREGLFFPFRKLLGWHRHLVEFHHTWVSCWTHRGLSGLRWEIHKLHKAPGEVGGRTRWLCWLYAKALQTDVWDCAHFPLPPSQTQRW